MHRLDGAYERVNRAGVHLSDLNERINVLSLQIRDGTIIEGKPKMTYSQDTKQIEVFMGKITPPSVTMPYIIPILIGEILYNLRSALDYLVYELARLGSGDFKDDTQFPFDDKSKVFDTRNTTWLKGVKSVHIAAIKDLQPCNGCDWACLLRDLSNPDKHRYLTITEAIIENSVPFSSLKDNAKGDSPSNPMDMKADMTVEVQFVTRKNTTSSPITFSIHDLQQLKLQVTQVLDAFNPEFK